MDVRELAEKIRPVAEEEGLRLAVLFGSEARGDALAGADLDIAVDAGRLVDAVDLTNRLGVALGHPDVDLVDLRRADPVLQMAVATEGVAIYEGEESAFASFQSLAARRFYDTRKFREAEREWIHDTLARLERSP